jgi:hypothetical protein
MEAPAVELLQVEVAGLSILSDTRPMEAVNSESESVGYHRADSKRLEAQRASFSIREF